MIRCSLYILVLLLICLSSCQKEDQSDTRIPPVLENAREEWQKTAILSLTDLIRRGLDREDNYFKRARIYFDQENYPAALSDINTAIEGDANRSDFFLLRGKIYMELEQIEKALADAERSEALQQSSPELYILLADIYQSGNNHRKAVAYLNQAMKMTPFDGSVYFVKGMIQAHQGDSLASLESLREAINLNPRFRRAYEESTRIYRRLGKPTEALQINNLAINRFPDRPELYFERGEVFRIMALPDTAIIQYRKAVALKPDYEKALMQWAKTAIGQKAYSQALPPLEKLQQIRPADTGILELSGYAFEKLGNFVQAKAIYTRILESNSSNQNARYGMYRIQSLENAYLQKDHSPLLSDENESHRDSSRIKISPIQPKGTINLKIDTLRKAKIE
ncbi:tetratricopeptide repeat protein [Dyadobacter tibetensis]|uniref:tetratricopeptide repeat protein n=1 Tax=Dyadobacter tibetensis TaxID=1211851 RepID=UPI00046EEE5C|nr:tetratricopeptide repeat protein [Dyadobacter tibetensis]